MELKWDIYWIDLDEYENQGHEQKGQRPVLIVSGSEINAKINTLNVIPLTTRKDGRVIHQNEVLLDTHKDGEKIESIALVHQLRTIDKDRLKGKMMTLTDKGKRSEITKAIRYQLDFD